MPDERRYTDSNKPGRKDVNGQEWWACDPYPTWFRWDDDELKHGPSGAWVDEVIEARGELYSNCVILDFAAPITRAQLDRISELLDTWALPRLRCTPVCGERDGNSVVPTIAADEN